ncbi:MAG: DUF3732 domain-containing protein [Thermoguttaceae bacterium]
MSHVNDDIRLAAEKLRGIAIRKREVEQRSEDARAAGYRQSERDRFLGRLERALEVYRAVEQHGDLASEVTELQSRAEALTRLISRAGVESRRNRALQKVSLFASHILPRLDAERPNDPIELRINDLTIRVRGQSRDDYLWEIGSGANWLSYHVAISLSLQRFFVENEPGPVPSFLVYDQPSQVYFPRRLAASRKEDPLPEQKLDDEDVEAVRKVFSVLAETASTLKGHLQILVLDHAPSDVEGVHPVEEWRGGRKLVPPEWL